MPRAQRQAGGETPARPAPGLIGGARRRWSSRVPFGAVLLRCFDAAVALIALFALGLPLSPTAAAQQGIPADQTLSTSPAPYSEQRFGEIPPFSFTERSGETITLESLRGAPWVAVPFFVRCTGPCPSLTGDIRAMLYEELEGTGVRIVSFSVDPEFDTPAELASYAERFKIEDDRWLFVTGPKGEVPAFVRDALGVPVARAAADSGLPAGEMVTHGTKLPVIDETGRIAGWYECAADALGREGIVSNFEALAARAKALAGVRPFSPLPPLNACLNALAAFCLICGLLAIKAGKKRTHERWMKAAFVASAVFLASYLYYHFVVTRGSGPTRYPGDGLGKTLYLVLLASHVILAVVNLPMVLRTFWLAHREDWERHKRLAKLTFPLWLYVSVTGVAVYVVLYHLV